MLEGEELRALSQRMIDEAIGALTEKPVNATTLERIRLFAEADDRVQGLPQPIQYGRGLMYVLEHISLPLSEHDQILGRVVDKAPDEEEEAFYQTMCRRFARRWWEDTTRPHWIFDTGHTSFFWRDVIEQGLSGLEARAQEQLEARRAQGASQEVLNYLEGAVLVYRALETFLLRYAQAARSAGLLEAAEACEHGARRPPQTFREALQMLWIVMLVYCTLLAINPTLAYGRLDQFLYPLYRRDLEEGRLTREQAGLLILDFYAKNNLIMGRGEHQLGVLDAQKNTGWNRNLNYDAPQYLALGGSDAQGQPASNDLTLLFAQQIVPRFKNPVIVVHYSRNMARQYPELWRTLVDKMRSSASMMVYNEENVIQGYLLAGVDPEDARNFEHYGCNWPCLPGMDSGGAGDPYLWMNRMSEQERRQFEEGGPGDIAPGGLTGAFLQVLREAVDQEETATIDSLYEGLRARFHAHLCRRYERVLFEREMFMRQAPGVLMFQDCFSKEAIRRAADMNCGGAKYWGFTQSYGGFATLVDSLTAVDELVFRKRQVTLAQLWQALEDNFEHDPVLRARCVGVEKLGSDGPLSNAHGRRLLTMLTDEVYAVRSEWDEKGCPPLIVRQSIETDTRHIAMGALVGATPDGRLAGAPLSQNTQPSVGAAVNGLTAQLHALAQLPLRRILSGALNVSIQPKLFEGEQGLALLGAVLSAYLDMGGLQLQISAVDVEQLREAQRNPEAHRDLMVRVTGYSAVFVDMVKESQEDIIRREAGA